METENKVIEIPIFKINEPEHAMRSNAYDDDVEALAASIAQVGLLQPITVRAVDERFEIIAGHRRFLACRFLNLETISAIVKEADDIKTEAMKVHENLFRVGINPVDEAIFLAEYQQRHNLTIEQIAEQINRTPQWVKSRLEILSYPEYLQQFVYDQKLSLGTAAILNQIENPAIKEKFCRDAATTGLSASRAKYWLQQANASFTDPTAVREMEAQNPETGEQVTTIMFRCVLSGEEYPADQIEMVTVHPENLRAVIEALNRQETTTG